jgi:tetratricopeptide (TPR) repeat protein
MRTTVVAAGFAALLTGPLHAAGDRPASEPTPGCGTFRYESDRIGPLDYRYIDPKKLNLVETYHFSREVEALRRGRSGTIGGDLAYTLNAIPNHPRALRATADYFRRSNDRARREMHMGLQCWFDRAISFRPDDPLIRILYADELVREGRRDEARSQLQAAEPHAGDSATVNYNLGLLYYDLKDFNRSTEYAKKAYSLGAPLPGLRDKLVQAGKWQD